MSARAFRRVSSYGEITDTSAAAPWRVNLEATQPMRSMFVSRSSFEKPRPLDRCVRATSPSRYSTLRPRRSSSGPTSSAIVVFPALGRPVNQTVNPSVICLLDQRCVRMDPTFDLVGVRPAAGTLVLALDDGTRARDAADRRVADVVQRVVRNLVHADVRLHALRVPVDDRLDLPDVVALAPLDAPRVRARERLLAADAADPGSEGLERALERLDLANVAAAVRIALPQVRAFVRVLLRDGDDVRPDQLQAVALDEAVARLVRLPEEQLRVELDHGDVEPELRDHVHEHRRLLLPRAREAELVAELLVRPDQHVLGAHALDVRKVQAACCQAESPSACRRAARAAASRAGSLLRAECCRDSPRSRSA